VPIGLAILTFFLTEGFYLVTRNNLEAGFLPSVILAGLLWLAATIWVARWADERNNPQQRTYKVPMPRAFAMVKSVLRRSYNGTARWRIHDDDPKAGCLHASINWFDEIDRDMRWLAHNGRLERMITLDCYLTANEDGTTTVQLCWTVDSPISAMQCYAVIGQVSDSIDYDLTSAEVMSHERTARSA